MELLETAQKVHEDRLRLALAVLQCMAHCSSCRELLGTLGVLDVRMGLCTADVVRLAGFLSRFNDVVPIRKGTFGDLLELSTSVEE
jgi:hypothetical protein